MGGSLTEVNRGIPDGLTPPAPDDSGGLSGGEVAAIVVVLLIVVAMVAIVAVGVLAVMQKRRRKFELRTAGDNYPSIDGTYHTDTFEKGGAEKARTGSGTFPLRPSAHSYSPVPATVTTVLNEGALSSDKGVGEMREEEEEGEAGDITENDPLGESSKDTHL